MPLQIQTRANAGRQAIRPSGALAHNTRARLRKSKEQTRANESKIRFVARRGRWRRRRSHRHGRESSSPAWGVVGSSSPRAEECVPPLVRDPGRRHPSIYRHFGSRPNNLNNSPDPFGTYTYITPRACNPRQLRSPLGRAWLVGGLTGHGPVGSEAAVAASRDVVSGRPLTATSSARNTPHPVPYSLPTSDKRSPRESGTSICGTCNVCARFDVGATLASPSPSAHDAGRRKRRPYARKSENVLNCFPSTGLLGASSQS